MLPAAPAERVLAVVATLAADLAHGPTLPAATVIDADLEGELGIDSLARVELALRIERALGVRLPDDAIDAVPTPRALVAALADALPAIDFTLPAGLLPEAAPAPPGRPDENAPRETGRAEGTHGTHGTHGNSGTETPARRPSRLAALPGAIWSALVWAMVAVVGLAISVLPGLARRRAATRQLARAMLRLLGIRVVVEGARHLVRDRPVVMVANHGSYLDAIVITATIDRDFAFVAKSEFAERWISRHLLGAAGTHFVERFDPRASVAHAWALGRVVREGGSLLVFPEGTFVDTPGLLPFRLGAFFVAAEAEAPLVPLAIAGARAVLPFPSWRARRGVVTLTIAPPIHTRRAEGDDAFTHAVGLRKAARAAILPHCGEPDAQRRQTGPAVTIDA